MGDGGREVCCMGGGEGRGKGVCLEAMVSELEKLTHLYLVLSA